MLTHGPAHSAASASAERLERRLPASLGSLAVLAFYAAGAICLYVPVLPFSTTHIFACPCEDAAQQSWFIGWMTYSLEHASNPFFTSVINIPYGVNLIVNTSTPLVGVLVSPVTAALGPVAGINVAMRLAFWTSSASMFFVLRRLGLRTPAAALGGLIYGFSPYVIGQAYGHLQMAYIFVPPLWLLGLVRLTKGVWSERRTGLWLGALAVIQFFVGIEILISLIICSLLGLVVGLLLARPSLSPVVRSLFTVAAWGGVVVVPALVVPVWYLLLGPQALAGPQQPVAVLGGIHGDILSPIVPTSLQAFAPGGLARVGNGFGGGSVAENGVYIGIPALIVAAVGAYLGRRERWIACLAPVGVAAYILTLGPHLTLAGRATGLKLPFDVFSHLPILQDQVPLRYSLYVQLAAAVLVAYALHRGLAAWRHRGAAATARVYGGMAAVGLAVMLVGLSLWPSAPYPSPATSTPHMFVSSEAKDIPANAVTLVYPYPQFPIDQAMLWQAETGFRFRLLGGYVYNTTSSGGSSLVPPTLRPALVQTFLADAYSGAGTDSGLLTGVRRSSVAKAMRSLLHRYHVRAIIVAPVGRHFGAVVRVVTVAAGQPPLRVGGVFLWLVQRHR